METRLLSAYTRPETTRSPVEAAGSIRGSVAALGTRLHPEGRPRHTPRGEAECPLAEDVGPADSVSQGWEGDVGWESVPYPPVPPAPPPTHTANARGG